LLQLVPVSSFVPPGEASALSINDVSDSDNPGLAREQGFCRVAFKFELATDAPLGNDCAALTSYLVSVREEGDPLLTRR
jgi:hypothetical protein